MDFIFMLTKNDKTVPDAMELLKSLEFSDLKHVGCKEIGAPPELLRELVEQVEKMGGTSYLELVGSTSSECLAAADRAIELGFDCLFGGVEPDVIHERCKGLVDYYPFAGRIEGHPVELRGTAKEIADDCRDLCERGYPGIDLLVYRAVDDRPEAILNEARAATTGKLFVAGSVDSPERINQSDDCIIPRKPRTKPSDIGGGDGGGNAVGRGKGKWLRMSRTQSRNRHVTEAARPRIGAAWAAQAPMADYVRPSTGARCVSSARRDLCGGSGITRPPTATIGALPIRWS
jgi:hypothetical protein